jgi:RNA-directed DNA polymerase
VIFDAMTTPENKQAFLTAQGKKLGEADPTFVQMAAYLAAPAFEEDVLRLKAGDYWFGIPRKSMISKYKTDRKRVAYVFDDGEQCILKYIAFLLHRYDDFFSENLYSFCKNRNTQKVLKALGSGTGAGLHTVFQLDIAAYGISIDAGRLTQQLREVLANDPSLFDFFDWLLNRKLAMVDGEVVSEDTGALPGIAPSAFFCNLYLDALDKKYQDQAAAYFRYADDVFMGFADPDQARRVADAFTREVKALGLTLNAQKTGLRGPGEPWIFLGFLFTEEGQVDIAPVTVEKMKGRIRRQARKWRRQMISGRLSQADALAGFLAQTNRKFFGEARLGMNYAQWYFPIITRTDSLQAIDAQVQRYLRYIVTGRFTKKNYNIRYDDLKTMGYRSLVRAYYHEKEKRGRGK